MSFTLGIVLGLGCAAFSSLSYLASRLFVQKHHSAPLRLLVLGHVLMGIAAVVGLAILWPGEPFPWGRYIKLVVPMGGFYLLGQCGLFLSLRHNDASQIAPLLSLKIVLLAAITSLYYHHPLSGIQWAGAVLAVLGALVLNLGKARLGIKTVGLVVAMCLAYAISDLNIVASQRLLGELDYPHPVLFAVASCYTLCGLAAVIALPLVHANLRSDLKYAAAWAGAWSGAMLCLFASLAIVGVVLGGILQSTRGLVSILLGAALAAMGWEHLETRHDRRVLLRRVVAAAMMVAAIVLYSLGRS
jgi:drug/metabolite transporter (DMT)-like permease